MSRLAQVRPGELTRHGDCAYRGTIDVAATRIWLRDLTQEDLPDTSSAGALPRSPGTGQAGCDLPGREPMSQVPLPGGRCRQTRAPLRGSGRAGGLTSEAGTHSWRWLKLMAYQVWPLGQPNTAITRHLTQAASLLRA